jgi:hypothetical protein
MYVMFKVDLREGGWMQNGFICLQVLPFLSVYESNNEPYYCIQRRKFSEELIMYVSFVIFF